MSIRRIDPEDPSFHLPDVVVMDTNVVIALLLTSGQQNGSVASQHAAFFEHLSAERRQAILTPTDYGELLHASIRLRYQQELEMNRAAISARFGRRITSWTELHKRDPSIARAHESELEHLRRAVGSNYIAIADPAQLGEIPSGRSFEEELIHLIGRYGLDTNDALILMEASRLGISAIVTMDRDMQRALPDFDVYTWV